VVSGTKEDITDFNNKLDSQDIPNKILLTSHAFHSFMMDPILESFKNEVEKIISNNKLEILNKLTIYEAIDMLLQAEVNDEEPLSMGSEVMSELIRVDDTNWVNNVDGYREKLCQKILDFLYN
jgi:malonyl CoA-acyl carrier protein transacylase